MTAPTIVWFRRDLRLADNPALQAAVERGGPVVPLFIWAPDEESPWSPGGAARWWLHQSLEALQASLHQHGVSLVIRQGSTLDQLRQLVHETGARAVMWNRRYEPTMVQRDQIIKRELKADGLVVESGNASLLFEPWELKNKQGGPFKVFTPFWRTCVAMPEPAMPLAVPKNIKAMTQPVASLALEDLKLEPVIDWAGAMREHWPTGEAGAMQMLEKFVEHAATHYQTQRDEPGVEGTSGLSPYLQAGLISPRQIWHRLRTSAPQGRVSELGKGAQHFLREVGWREFAYHLLYHFPHTTDAPLRDEFAKFPWVENDIALRAWQKGQTGYPIVDAGMRQLWSLGWMHNRVRMIAASFLVKDLLIPWQAGAKWFWDTLIDADLASNTLGWQWSAGCGADAAPYFRIFNPVLQGEKFDPQGAYVRQWVPEVAKLPDAWIHKPWEAPAEVLLGAQVTLGESYPRPMVDHHEARDAALQALATISA